VRVRLDLRRLRSAELLGLLAGIALAVSLFLPWYDFDGTRRDAWSALTVTEWPAALAAALALALVAATALQRSPALPVAVAVWTTVAALAALVAIVLRALAAPAGADARCYGLWIALAAVVGVLLCAWWAMSDERPFRERRLGGT
jgi:hypothetical protein